MTPTQIANEVKKVLTAHKGQYMTAYQIYDRLPAGIRHNLMSTVSRRGGKMAGLPYSKYTTVAQAAKMVADNTESFLPEGILFQIKTDGIYISSGYPDSLGIYLVRR